MRIGPSGPIRTAEPSEEVGTLSASREHAPLPFGAADRALHLDAMTSETLDVFIIGGGITGAGILWDATLRGLRAGLVEMQDFAAGTSSRSTKLIHGGLRYLEQYEVGLVREVAQERSVLAQLAPHLVRPLPMLLPVLPGARHGTRTVAAGIWLYDRLAHVDISLRRRMLTAAEARIREPLLPESVLGAALYYEYTTDDARLTLSVVRSAVAHGGFAANYAVAGDFRYDPAGKVTGVEVTDLESGRRYPVRARAVINATGPWSDRLRLRDDPHGQPTLRLAKGVHIVLPRERLPLEGGVYFDLTDGRMLFAIPHGRVTYVGTTDTEERDADPREPRAGPSDIRYLLEGANRMFPGARLTEADVVSTWAGYRALASVPGRSTEKTSRRDVLLRSPTGLLTIAGGKLTGFRKMAERIVEETIQMAHLTVMGQGRTAHIPLAGGVPVLGADWETSLRIWTRAAEDAGLDERAATCLARTYGSDTPDVLDVFRRQNSPGDGPEKLFSAILSHAVEAEMALRPLDYLVRRTGSLFFAPERFRAEAPWVLAHLGERFAWDRARYRLEVEAVSRAYRDATGRDLGLRAESDGENDPAFIDRT